MKESGGRLFFRAVARIVLRAPARGAFAAAERKSAGYRGSNIAKMENISTNPCRNKEKMIEKAIEIWYYYHTYKELFSSDKIALIHTKGDALMAKFCRNCGMPLEDGRCPICEEEMDESYTKHGVLKKIVSEDSTFYFLFSDWRKLAVSVGALGVIHAIGFVVISLCSLFEGLYSLEKSWLYTANQVFDWIYVIGCLLVGIGAIRFIKEPDVKGSALILLCVSVLLGIASIVNLFSLLVRQYTIFDVLTPCLFMLNFGLCITEKNRMIRGLCMGGAGAIAGVLVLSALTRIPLLPQLTLCFAAACGAAYLLKVGDGKERM